MSEDEPGKSTELLSMAQKLHDQFVAEGKQKREEFLTVGQAEHDRLISEAQVEAQKIVSDAREEIQELTTRIQGLKDFEAAYRANLVSELSGLLDQMKNLE